MAIDVASLAGKVHGSVLTPDDAGYAELIRRWALNAEKHAAVIVLPTSSADVAAAVSPSEPPA
jgi:hypothetical protein